MKQFGRYFGRLLGLTIGIFGLPIAIICWVFKADDNIPMLAFILILIGIYLFCVLMFSILYYKKDIQAIQKIKVITTEYVEKGDILYFITENSRFLMQSSYVTICYESEDSNREIVLGAGYVDNLNNNDQFQIRLAFTYKNSVETTEIIQDLKKHNNKNKHIVIKPCLRSEFLEGMQND